MKKIVQSLSLLLCILLTLPVAFAACDNTDDPEPSDNSQTSDIADTSAESSNESANASDTSDTTESLENGVYIYEDKIMNYTIIYPFAGNSDTKNAAVALNRNFYQRVNNPAEKPLDDFDTAKKTECEMLVGDTNRDESKTLKEQLGDNSYLIRFVGKKLVIVAAEEWMLEHAVSDLIQNIRYIKNSSNKFVSATLPEDFELSKKLDLYTRNRWTLVSFPAYGYGLLANGSYSAAYGYTTLKHDAANYSMIIASKTDFNDFRAYIEVLKNEGYTVEITSDTENVLGMWVTKNGAKMYAYYTDGSKEARFILDKESTTASEYSYTYAKKSTDTTTVYLYGIAMDPNGENNSTLADHKDADNNNFYGSNCGMSMVIKLADNSVIMIDGGGYAQMSQEAAQKLDTFLHDITGTAANDKVTIRAWYLSHPHGDHYTGFIRFIVNYHQNYDIKSVMYNLRSCPSDLREFLGDYLPVYYPSITYHRPHTGEIINIADVKFNILYTFEDLISHSTLSLGSTDDNDTSTVTMVEVDGKKFLITGDIYVSAESVLVRNYDNNELKCDVLQVPHHGLNNTVKLFEKAAPSVSLFTQSKRGAKEANKGSAANVYNNVAKYTVGGEANMYFADGYYDKDGNAVDLTNSGIIGVCVVDGELKVTTSVGDHTPYPSDKNLQWEQFDDFNGNKVEPIAK